MLLLPAVRVIVPVANPLELVRLSDSWLSAGPHPRGKELPLLQAAQSLIPRPMLPQLRREHKLLLPPSPALALA